MNILLANDDGVNAPGLAALAKEMSKLGDVYVAAPEGERSSNSHHLTIMGRLRFQEKAVPFAKKAYALWGTPADCTHMGLKVLFDKEFDLVISGINRGRNVSTDIIYSGTIAAAREAYLQHVPAMAVSLDSFVSEDYSVAAEYARIIAEKFLESYFYKDCFLNINVPSLPADKIRGIQVCDRTGEIEYNDAYSIVKEDEISYIQILPSQVHFSVKSDDLRIDINAVREGFVSVSALGNRHILKDLSPDLKGMLKL